MRTSFRVERPHTHWELVKYIEISVVLLSDQFAQSLFLRCGEVGLEAFLFCGIDSCIPQDFDTL